MAIVRRPPSLSFFASLRETLRRAVPEHVESQRTVNRSRPRLEIVLLLAKEANAFVEQASIGVAQTKIIRELKNLAANTGHKLGIYYPVSRGEDGEDVPTYIHSKLFLIDDCFLSIGSANMNNRSMGADTECDLAIEARNDRERAAVREIRNRLLGEHCGVSAADVAAGFCAGTPLRMEMAARGDLEAGTKAVAAEMTARLGEGPVTAPMTAYVVEARPSPQLPG